METTLITIANLKCNGCATTIKKELLALKGSITVEVDNDNDLVTITSDNLERNVVAKKLHNLEYPEATEENGLLSKLKSFQSCMIGRINNL